VAQAEAAGIRLMGGILDIGIWYRECANGETYEFRLTINGKRVSESVWLSVHAGQTVEEVAAVALVNLLPNPQ
jgi:hypothetical protein